MKHLRRRMLVTILSVSAAVFSTAQSVSSELLDDVRRSAGMNYALPVETALQTTPPPAGKHPFYINHYGCPTSYYLEQHDSYETATKMLASADSLGMLTPLGRDVLRKVTLLLATGRQWSGELTEMGKQQARAMGRQLVGQLPELFTGEAVLDGRSIVQRNCLLTLGETMLVASRANSSQRFKASSSYRHQSWMDPQDKLLEAIRKDSVTKARFNEFSSLWAVDDSRLLGMLFNDAGYAKTIDGATLCRQLFDLAGFVQYADQGDVRLYDLFTPEEIHRRWMLRNAWAYINYGGCLLSGGHQHYTQRKPLWNLLHQCDSVMTLDYPVTHIRVTQQHVVMSLVCLLELNGYGVQTARLDSLESLGWVDYRIAPLGGSLMLIHYRSDKNDPDPLVRVLLNGREARLPISTDCAPYYHWKDVKRYYLRKLYVYSRERNDE